MYYNSEEQNKYILQIQRILRDLGNYETGLPKVRLSGVYDGETKEAIEQLQKKYGLPPTSVVDYATWQVLQAVDRATKEAYELARAIYILPRNADYVIYPDLKDNVIYVIQHLLNVISQEYDEIGEIPFTGIYDSATQNAIKEFQRKVLLEADGIINATTFNALAQEYERINSYNE